jgi:hypothetical protein
MSAAAGPFTIAAVLLAVAGVLKALDPVDTANALRGVGVPASRTAVRVGGLVEAAVGVFAVVSGGILAAVLVGVSYLGFSVFVAVAMASHSPIATCGCFGKDDTPPSLVHLGIDLAAVGAAIAVAVQPGVGIGDVLSAQPLGGAPYLLLVLVGVGATSLALTALPRTMALARADGSR